MKIEEAPLSAADEVEDEISDEDEDSLAGQMAAMRVGSAKKRQEEMTRIAWMRKETIVVAAIATK